MRADDSVLEHWAPRFDESRIMSCKRAFVCAPQGADEFKPEKPWDPPLVVDTPDACSGCDGWNPFRDEYMQAHLHHYTTRAEKDPDRRLNEAPPKEATRWGLKMGMTPYDPELKHHFEDRRLNKVRFTANFYRNGRILVLFSSEKAAMSIEIR